jgi:hypothetical protein
MPVSLISLPELKTYLGITGTSDDSLLASCASNASAIAAADTSRVFAVSSNVTRRYSTDGQTALTVHDRPYNDATRVVSWLGVALVQDTNYWLLPDRRNPDVGTVIQLRPFDLGQSDYYKADPLWWDKNLDRRRWAGGVPNDLVVTGTEGHPSCPTTCARRSPSSPAGCTTGPRRVRQASPRRRTASRSTSPSTRRPTSASSATGACGRASGSSADDRAARR